MVALFSINVVSAVQEENATTFEGTLSSATNKNLGQSFTALNNYTLDTVSFNLQKLGNPIGNMEVYLYSESGDLGVTKLDTSNTVVANSVSTSYGYINFTGFSYSIVSGTKYVLIINSTSTHTAEDKLNIGGSFTSNFYTGGRASTDFSLNPANNDFNFITYSIAVPSPIINFQEVKINNVTNFNNTFYNSTPQLLEVTLNTTDTNNNTNVTLYMYNSTNDLITTNQFITNNLTGNYNISFPYEDTFKFFLNASNNETSTRSPSFGNYTINFDGTNPVIINNVPATITSYQFLDSYFSCTDTNIQSCNISIDGLNKASGTNFTLTHNGNLSYNITAIDLAGNTVIEAGTILINPSDIFYFENNVTSAAITDFYINGVLYNNSYSFNHYDFGLGSNSVEFSKAGFVNTTINFELNNTNQLNTTYSIEPVTIFMRAFDTSTYVQLTFDVVVQNSTDIVTFTNLTSLDKMYAALPNGDITFTVSAAGYSNGIYVNTLTQYTSLVFDVYLTPTNVTDVVIFTTKDFYSNLPLGSVLIEAQEIINSTTVTVQQVYTDEATGSAYLSLNSEETYTFVFSKDGYVLTSVGSIPNVLTYTIKLKPDTTQYSYIDDINYRFTPTQSTLYPGNNYTFTGFISGTSISFSNFSITTNNGSSLYYDTSTNPTGTTFTYVYALLNTTNITEIILTMSYVRDGITQTVSRGYNVLILQDSEIKSATDFANDSSEEAKLIRFFVILVTFIAFIVFSQKFQQGRDFVSIILLIPLLGFIFISWIPLLYGTIMIVALIVLFMGGNKQ